MEENSNHPFPHEAEALLQTIDYEDSLTDPDENASKLKRYVVSYAN